MTDRPDTQERLDELDRRATAAIAALDRAVDATPLPDRSAAEPVRRSIPPIAVAAALVVLALVAAGLLFTGGDEESTVAGEVDFTHLALPDPGALGYRIEAVSDGRQREGVPADSQFGVTATIQGPIDADDPWTEAIVSYSLPSTMTTLDGDPIDIGGPEAYFSDDGLATVGWIEGDQTRYLMSTRLDRDQLVDVATEAVSGDDPADRAIPGHEVLYTGVLDDVFPSAVTIGRGGIDRARSATIVYGDSSGDGQRLLAVATTSGTDDDVRAGTVLAETTRDVSVRGRDAVLAEFFGGLLHLSWLEPDGTLVRADTFGIDADTVVDHLDRLESVSPAEFALLADDVPPESGPDTATETVDDVLASVEIGEGDVVVTGRLLRSEDGQLGVELAVDRSGGGDASGASIASLDEPVALRHDLDDGRTLVAGLIGPSADGVVDLSFPDADVFDDSLTGPTTATIEGSQSLFFLVIVPQGLDPDGGQVLTTSPDGGEITLPL